MFKRFNFRPMSLLKLAAMGFVGVFAHKLIGQYIDQKLWRWTAYLLLLTLGISTPIAIEIANTVYKEEI